MQVLVALSRSAGKIVTRDQLLRTCWDGRIVGEDAINRAICRIRSLSDLDAGESFRIETVPRIGYRMLVEAPLALVSNAGVKVSDPAPPSSRVNDFLARACKARPFRAAAAMGALLFMTSVAAVTHDQPAEAKPALAVLPFADLSPQQACRFFGQGVAEEIMASLAAQPSLRVVGRSALNTLQPNANHKQVRETLGVSFILEGSVNHRHSNEHVRVTVRLVRASDGTQLWARSFDRPLDDIFAVQREIGLTVANQVVDKPLNISPRPSTDWETFKLYATARGMLQEGDPERTKSARDMLEKAVERDSRYTPARAALNRLAGDDV